MTLTTFERADAIGVLVAEEGGDAAFCPGDSATFRFYAEYDSQTTVLQRFDR